MKYTLASRATLTEMQIGQLNQLICCWFDDNESHPDHLKSILGTLHFEHDANFLMIHHGLMAIKEADCMNDDILESFFTSTTFDPETGDDNFVVIPSNRGKLRVAWWPIIEVNLARNLQNVSDNTDPGALEFVPHRLGHNNIFRLRPYVFEKLFYCIRDDILAQALGGSNENVAPVTDARYEQCTEFINDVYRFGWTGLEFTPIWKG